MAAHVTRTGLRQFGPSLSDLVQRLVTSRVVIVEPRCVWFLFEKWSKFRNLDGTRNLIVSIEIKC